VLYKKPNKLSVNSQGMTGTLLIVSNGKTIYQYSSFANEYTQRPAPANLLDEILLNAGAGNHFKQVGNQKIGGVSVTVLKGTSSSPQGPVQTTFYIDQKNSLPYRIVVVLTNHAAPGGGMFRMISEQTFSSQKLNGPMPDSAFRFVPPASAAQVTSLGPLGGSAGSEGAFPGAL